MDVRLCLMLKAPLAGRVKTRLAAGIGEASALAAYRALVAGVLAAAAGSGLPATIFYAPAGEEAAMRELCGPGWTLAPQAAGDLGARMAAAMTAAFAAGAAGALVVGGDLPLVSAALLAGAGAALQDHDAVLGPALDGGYYALGLTRAGFLPDVFAAMPWSTPAVFARTRDVLAAAGRRVALLPALPDCDTADDLRRLARPPWRARLAGTPFGAFLARCPGVPFDHDPDNRLSPE